MKVSFCLCAAMVAVTSGLAEDVSGPVLGYVKKADTVRPILGIPGAAYFAPPFDQGDWEVAAVSSQSGYAVFWNGDRTAVRIASLSGSPAASTLEPGSPVRDVRLSESGAAAVLVRTNSLDVVLGLPAKAAISRTLELPADTRQVAVSDDGEAVAVFDGSTLTRIDRSGTSPLGALNALQDLRFRQGSHDLLYVDGTSIMAVSPQGSRMVAGRPDNLVSPRFALFSRDGQSVLIAESASQEFLVARLAGGISERISAPCAVAAVSPLNDATFSFSCEGSRRTHLLELSSAQSESRVLFVPEPVE